MIHLQRHEFCANDLKVPSAYQQDCQPGSADQLGNLRPLELWSRQLDRYMFTCAVKECETVFQHRVNSFQLDKQVTPFLLA